MFKIKIYCDECGKEIKQTEGGYTALINISNCINPKNHYIISKQELESMQYLHFCNSCGEKKFKIVEGRESFSIHGRMGDLEEL